MAHICAWPGCQRVVKADWIPLCYRHQLESREMGDQQPPDPEERTSPPQPRQESRSNPPSAPATGFDIGAEIRKALDAMVQGGEIEFGTEEQSAPQRNWAGPIPNEDEETRFERFLAARDAKNNRDSEEKAFREKVTKQLDRKPRWFEPWRP
jgi:hypothetical protein